MKRRNMLGIATAVGFMLAATANAAPPVTTGLKLHLDASQLTGLSDGATVTTWTDKVSWTMDAAYQGTYEVQTSPDLVTWTNVDPKPLPADGSLSYTLPPGAGKLFVRLLVTPTP